MKIDKIKANQKITLNLINNKISNNIEIYYIFIRNDRNDLYQQLFFIFLNFENDYKEEITKILYKNKIEFIKLLIGAYTYF